MAQLSAQPIQAGVDSIEQDLRAASARLGVPFVRIGNRVIVPEVLARVPEEIARESQMVPYEESVLPSGRRVLRLAVADPRLLTVEAPAVITDLHTKSGMVIEVALTTPADLAQALKAYQREKSRVETKTPAQTSASKVEYPTIDLVGRSIPMSILQRIPEDTARKYRVAVFEVLDEGQTIRVAVEDPDAAPVKELLAFIGKQNHLKLVPYRTSSASLDAALAQYGTKPEPIKKPVVAPVSTESKKPKSSPKSGEARHLVSPLPGVPAQPPQSSLAAQPPKAPVVRPEDLTTPELHVPTTPAAPSPLIPLAADVERDMRALVGQDITTTEALESVVRTGFIPKIVGALILFAITREASDIHIQASGDQLLVRYRIDGILQDVIKMPSSLQAPIISRIKILARLKIDEQRIPQDGRFDVAVGDRAIDLRISTFPTVYGEKVVARLLDKSAGLLEFASLGLIDSRLERIRDQIHKPYGVVLATGPTGSGKSTLLYAILAEIATPTVNVVTLEDPVEYEMPGVSQAQIQPKIGFGFAEGLRSILRQDPNIIMVGEIRDLETASMVTHAALTGHLVLSTLHTNDAAGALPRLINMGVEPFLITSAMNAIVAQRLVRRLCEKCRVPWEPPAEISDMIRERLSRGNLPELTAKLTAGVKLWKAKGCDACHDGYKGRVGLFEVLVMSEQIERLAVKKAPASEIAEAAITEGMVTMEQDGLVKALTGETTLDEVLRVTKTE